MSSYYLLLTSALMMGILGGAHCIGMCGGIVCALCYSNPTSAKKNWKPIAYQISYSLGRISTYTLLGAVAGLASIYISSNAGFNAGLILRYFSSVLIILVGLYVAGWWRIIASFEKMGHIIWRPLSKLTKYLLPVTNMRYAFLLGGLWGLLPCGLVYTALLYSMSAGNWMKGAGVMLFFGIGTLPALLLVGSTMQSYQYFLAKNWVRQLSGLTLVIFGVVSFVLLGVSHHSNYGCQSCHIISNKM
tara:strand:- start:490 stop:1224 length:735 start_codon:yes stop_codon:yes gene_type:complete